MNAFTDNPQLATEVAGIAKKHVEELRGKYRAARSKAEKARLVDDGKLYADLATDLRAGKWDWAPDTLAQQLQFTLTRIRKWAHFSFSGKRLCSGDPEGDGCCSDPACTPARHYGDVRSLPWLAGLQPGDKHYLHNANLADVIRARFEELQELAEELEFLADWCGPHCRRPNGVEIGGST